MKSDETSKYVGVVMLSDPTAVTAKLVAAGSLYDNGGIYVTCPELGFLGSDWLYCRYGLSIPYYKVQIGDTVLIEPTIGETERWFYTGLADCGGATATSATDVSITSTLSEILMTLVGTTHLGGASAVQPIPLGTLLIAAIDSMLAGGVPAPGDGGAALLASMTLAWNTVKAGTLSTKSFTN